MRGKALRALIVAGVTALPVDDPTSATDVYSVDDTGEGDQDQVKPDNTFELIQGQVSPNITFEGRTLRSVFELRFYWSDSPTIGDRIISAAERVLAWLPTIGAAMHPDCYGCDEIGDWIPAEDAVTGQIVCAVSFAVTYSLTGV